MDTLESELTLDELQGANNFYRRLKKPDFNNVSKIIHSVDSMAKKYFDSGEQRKNYYAFCDGNIMSGIKRVGTPFFAAYLIGGYLNKEGERPDIDLLVATNMRWDHGFFNPEWTRDIRNTDPMWYQLVTSFGQGSVQKRGELPDDYNVGATGGKVLITINPKGDKKIDLCYVRSTIYERRFKFIDEEQFCAEKDVDKEGRPLPRLPLYRLTSSTELPHPRW